MVEHARLAREVKVRTFESFLRITDEETKITTTARELFRTEAFDVKKYVLKGQQQRGAERRVLAAAPAPLREAELSWDGESSHSEVSEDGVGWEAECVR